MRITFTVARHASRAALDRDAQLIQQRASHQCLAVKAAVSGRSVVSLTGPRGDVPQLRALAVTGVLQFRQVLLEGPPAGRVAQSAGRPAAVSAVVRARYNRLDCASAEWKKQLARAQGTGPPAGAQIVSCSRGRAVKLALGPVRVSSPDIKDAAAAFSADGSGWLVQITLNQPGQAGLARFTSALYRRYHGSTRDQLNKLAIVEDGITVAAPSVAAPITGALAEIPGMASQQAATQLAAALMSGELPVPLTVRSVRGTTG